MAQMFSGEGLANRQGTPQRHLNASQVQLPSHNETIATVVTGPHQDNHAMAQQIPARQQPSRHGQPHLLHQGRNRHAAVEQPLFAGGHGRGIHKQMIRISGRPHQLRLPGPHYGENSLRRPWPLDPPQPALERLLLSASGNGQGSTAWPLVFLEASTVP